MSLLIFIFLHFLSTVSAFSVQVTNSPVAGGFAAVAWQRHAGDPSKFYLRLRKSPGNDNGGFTPVSAGFSTSGTTQVAVNEAGQFQIEVYLDPQNTFQGPRASSSMFTVQEAPPPPPPPPPPPTTTTTTTTTSVGPTQSTDTGTGETSTSSGDSTSTSSPDPPNNGHNTHTGGTSSTSGKGDNASDSATASASGSVIVVPNPTGGSPITTTFTPGPTPTVLTLLSDSQTLTTTIGIAGQTSAVETPPSDSANSGATSHTGAIIGAVLGSVFFVLFVALLFFIYRRRKRQQATSTFYRDKMVRSRTSPYGSNPSLAALTVATPTSDIPYRDLKEKIQDYDQTEISGEPMLNTHPEDFDPYSALYESGRPSYSSGMLAAAKSFHSSDVIPPSDEGLFTVSDKSRRSLVPSSMPVNSASSLGLEPPRTDRQMDIHERIVGLQTRMISLQSWEDGEEIEDLKRKISGLESVMDSPWALGRTDVIPREYSDANMH